MNNKIGLAAVVTTINGPNETMSRLLEYGQASGCPVVVVADTKTPISWEARGFEFLNLEKQCDIFGDFSDSIPKNHYARKNLGYLYAMRLGADWIYETDDDNYPTENPFKPRELSFSADIYAAKSHWLNIYRVFGWAVRGEREVVSLWPRGFDLRRLHETSLHIGKRKIRAPIQQGLANGDPDVDAIYRLVIGEFVDFNDRDPVGLNKFQICPTNSQTTWWHSTVHQLMYLPSTCTFRLTDILRGFVAWRILQEKDETVSFHSPIVRQDRNEHDLLRDFADETELFHHSDTIISELVNLDLRGLPLGNQMIKCFEVLIGRGVVSESEERLLQAWNAHF